MNKLEQYCCELHTGQWFGFSDPSEKTIDNLKLTDYGKEQGYSLPTQQEFENWKVEQQKLAKQRKIIAKRKKEYGKPESQIENIIEAINDGQDPLQAIKNEAERVKAIKEKYPKL